MIYDSLFETRVRNQVNDTNLEYIGIFGLFGRYNIEIPFDKQVNIFIGENGLGKTTILNCIYFVLEKKFSRLANIDFSEIKIKFRNNPKTFAISVADIRQYNIQLRGQFDFFVSNESYDNMIEEIVLNEKFLFNENDFIFDRHDILLETYTDHELEYIARKLAQKAHISVGFARELVRNYVDNKALEPRVNRKPNRNNVTQLVKAISENVTHRIIYLPTYRRIEDDLDSLNLRSEELDNAEQLINFGMSDVQKSIDRILKQIRSLAMEGFTAMTGVLLKQYADGMDSIDEMKNRKKYVEVEENTVKIVLDRVGKKIEEPYKEKILDLIKSGEIWDYKYYHLLNFINKLIDNYDLQKAYDDRIKQFADTCNKYLIDKQFNYNQSTLNLEIHLNHERNKKNRVISLMQLSSGEKQIVSLFSKLYLESNDSSIVIVDEPELSLSLNWQKMLLPDIMRTDKCDLLLTVTHSPFIFENEFDYDAMEIRRYIKRYKRG